MTPNLSMSEPVTARILTGKGVLEPESYRACVHWKT